MKLQILIAVAIVLVLVASYKLMKPKKSARDMAIDSAVKDAFAVKAGHHDLIVAALDAGATRDEHTALLENKERDVLAAIDIVEKEFGVVIDKRNPTQVGPIVVLER